MKKYYPGKCVGCHNSFNKDDKKLLFCSITCACLAGYMGVRNDFVPKYTTDELYYSKKLQDELLNNYPVRVNDRRPCKCHHSKEEIEERQFYN